MIVTPNLKLWLPFEGNAKDASGNGNHGAVYGASYVDSKFGKGLNFDGVDDCVNLGNILNDVFAGDQKKFSIRVLLNKTNDLTNHTILAKYSDSKTGGYQTMFRMFALSNYLEFIWMGNDSVPNIYARYRAVDFTFLVSGDYDIVMTYDGSLSISNRVNFVINGNFHAGDNYLNLGNPLFIYPATPPLVVGAYGSLNSHRRFFDGTIDEVMIFSDVLTLGDAKRIMHNLHPLNT